MTLNVEYPLFFARTAQQSWAGSTLSHDPYQYTSRDNSFSYDGHMKVSRDYYGQIYDPYNFLMGVSMTR